MKKRFLIKLPKKPVPRNPMSFWETSESTTGGPFFYAPDGNHSSKILLLTPVPTEDDYAQMRIFNDQAARIFRTMLREEIGLNIDDCLVVPCVREGTKALKANTRLVNEWVQNCVQRKLFKLVICIGDDAAKWIVNGGKKANIGALAGQMLYPKELKHTPLFLFPDVKGLLFEPHPNPRENFWREQMAQNHMKRLIGVARLLAEGIKVLFPQKLKSV